MSIAYKSFEVQQFEGLVVDFIPSWIPPHMAGTLIIDAQLTDHEVHHLVHPLPSKGLELIQHHSITGLGTVPLALLAGHEVQDDALVHLRAVVVVVHQQVVEGAADAGGCGCEEGQHKE